MVNSIADWICNLLLWTGVVTSLVLVHDAFVTPGTLKEPLISLVGAGLIVVLAAFWPRY
jgi:hypothetical protein